MVFDVSVSYRVQPNDTLLLNGEQNVTWTWRTNTFKVLLSIHLVGHLSKRTTDPLNESLI